MADCLKETSCASVPPELAYGAFPGADLGQDLSGSLQGAGLVPHRAEGSGAGGVGGLLIVSLNGTNCFPAFDGNGNVMSLVTASNGTIVAGYEYGPFGETLKANGALASANTFRFSTKAEDESGLLYYGYRYYDPETGGWLSRDPLGEQGGLNLYVFLSNSGSDIDVWGLAKYVEDPFPVPNVDRSKINRAGGMLRPATGFERWRIFRFVRGGGNRSTLADSLIGRYMDANGQGYALSESEASSLNALVRIQDIPEFSDLISRLKPGEKGTLKAVWAPTATLQNGTLGRFYSRVGGEVCKTALGWTFTGEVFYDDLYDFNTPGGVPEPGDLPPKNVGMPYERTSGGIGSGQWKIEWGEKHVPGCPFWVRSTVINATAESGDTQLKIGSSGSGGRGGEWRE